MCPLRPYKCRGHSQMYPSYYPNDEGSIFTPIMQAQSNVRFLSPKLCGHSRISPYSRPNDVGTFACARLDLRIPAGPVRSARILTQITRTQSNISTYTL